MGKVKIPYYTAIAGRGYWRPTCKMRALGFNIIRCGPDGPDAWAIAVAWNARWQAVRKGNVPPLVNVDQLTHDQAEAARYYPAGSVGAAFQVYLRTPEWAARAQLTRDKIWWPAWFRILDMWGDVAPDTIKFEMMSRWRASLERRHGRGITNKTLKVWRAFWKIMLGMKVAHTADPTTGIRILAPPPRWQSWSEGEAVRLVKAAWRAGYQGLACIIAVAWDTQFSPVDVRTLTARHRAVVGGRLIFDRQADGRAKTGRAAIGTLSPRTERLVAAYLATLRIELHPDAALFRTRSGSPYSRETLGHDFASVRGLIYPADKRRLMDMRRSGVVEAIVGDAGPLGLAAKLANSIDRANVLHKTYAPVAIEAVRNTDAARLRGRQRIRSENESGAKVSKEQPTGVSNSTRGGAK